MLPKLHVFGELIAFFFLSPLGCRRIPPLCIIIMLMIWCWLPPPASSRSRHSGNVLLPASKINIQGAEIKISTNARRYHQSVSSGSSFQVWEDNIIEAGGGGWYRQRCTGRQMRETERRSLSCPVRSHELPGVCPFRFVYVFALCSFLSF